MLSALLSSPSTVLVGARLDGAIDRWSQGATLLYGWTADEVVGRPLSVLVPPERRRELELITRLVRGEDVAPFETVRSARDGTQVPVELHLVLLRDEEGEPAGTVSLHRDLRTAQQLQLALRSRDEELAARFHLSPVPQSRVDLEGRILATNPAMQALLGRTAEQLLGTSAVDLYAEEARPAVLAALGQLTSHEVTAMSQEHDLLHADGHRVRTVTSVALVHDAGGTPVLAAAVEDVSALRDAQARVHTEAARFDALLSSTPVVVFTYDSAGVCTSSRGQGLGRLGYTENELVGRNLLEMYGAVPEYRDALQAPLDGRESRLRAVVNGADWKNHYRPLRDETGAVVGGIGISIDVTEVVAAEREVRAAEARLHSLLRNATDVAFVIDDQGRITYASPAALPQLGYDPAGMLGNLATDYNPPEDRETVARAWACIKDVPGATATLAMRVRHADGSLLWTEQVLTNLVEDPAVAGVVCNVRDVTDRRRADEELRRLAVRDGLTGLANRTLLLDRVEQALAAGRRSGAVPGLLVLDVVGMAQHNERLGQAGGDELLRVLGERLAAALRTGDSAARVGGDELAVLVHDVGSAEDLRALAATLVEIADEPVPVDGVEVSVELRVGSVLGKATDAGALLAAAERAVPHDRDRRVVVRSAEPADGTARADAVDRLRAAIEGDELVVHYQPVVRLDDQAPVGVEALVRWQHPERGLLPPSEFIPLAEDSGLVVALGEQVLRVAVGQLARWRDAGRALSVSVNLAPRQLVEPGLIAMVAGLLQEHDVAPDRLVLEMTESALLDDPSTPDVLRALGAMGVRLDLDDFGTGYSTLTYLKRFPVDAIKVDRSFVAGLGRNADDEAIVASVVSLARAVGKTVVAEGVETLLQLEALRALGADQAQGFLWTRGLPVDELEVWLDLHRTTPPAPRPARRRAPEPVDEEDRARILELHAQGASLHTIAAALNSEGRRTPSGPRWTTTTVARVVAAMSPPV